MRYSLNQLFRSGFLYYFKANFWVAMGIAVSTAVLTGGLIVGDSVKYSLEQSAVTRLGKITHTLTSGDRYFTLGLASRLHEKDIPVSTALLLEGMASTDGGQMRLNKIQVWGIDSNFHEVVVPDPDTFKNQQYEDSSPGVFISENTALRLNLSPGDEFLLRINKGSLLPANAPFVSSENQTATARLTVKGILATDQMGRLNLHNSQTAPYNLFIPIKQLNQLSGLNEHANVLLINSAYGTQQLTETLTACWSLEDAGLSLGEASADMKWELRSDRVFIEEKLQQAIEDSGLEFSPILTYFANSIAKNERSTPYSFVSTLPDELLDNDEIIINRWLANDLGAEAGDTLTISYYEIGPLRELSEKKQGFRVKAIEEIEGYFADRTLMPSIPGLSDSESCRDWDTGVPINLKSIRDKDEEYWYHFKGTPKAFISYSTGSKLWGNRFGNATALRFDPNLWPIDELKQRITEAIYPFDFDLQLKNIRDEGLQAARQGTDFSSLFLGLSFFILVSGILLTALLFVFNLERRKGEMGTLMALGFTPNKIKQLFLFEGLAIAAFGGLAGTGLAILYNELVFIGLNKVWHDIVRTDVLLSHYKAHTLLLGFLIGLVVAFVTLLLVLNSILNKQAASLQQQQQARSPQWVKVAGKGCAYLLLGFGLVMISVQILGSKQVDPGSFFAAGGALLVSSLLILGFALKRATTPPLKKPSGISLAIQNIKHHHKRSMLIVILLATGTFLVVSTGMNRKNFNQHAAKKESGTGGFLFWAESTVPILHNLSDERYKKEQNLPEKIDMVQFHVADGDDASCLNLNRISNPRLLGVDSKKLYGRFTFQTKIPSLKKENDLWPKLMADYGKCVPAIADQTVIQWSLGKKVGDTLVYRNSLGEEVPLLLIAGLSASVFQGNVIIDDTYFFKHFPAQSGSNVFLIDGKHEGSEILAEELNILFKDFGWELTLSAERLALFNSIERTYLSIFLVLGAIGLFIGTIGLAIVLKRSLLEREREFSVLLALGLTKKDLTETLLIEYLLLLFAGLFIGFVTALISVFPSLSGSSLGMSVGFVGLLMGIILLNGLLWILAQSAYAMKSIKISERLRNE